MQGRAFNQAFGSSAFDQAIGGGAFNQAPSGRGAFNQQSSRGAFGQQSAFNQQPALGQQPSNGVFNQQPVFGQQAAFNTGSAFNQQPSNGAFGQQPSGGAFGQQPSAFNQQLSGGAFNQQTPSRGAFNQQTSNRGAFNQQPSTHGAFNQQRSGRGAFNQSVGRGVFNQPTSTRGAFNQANGRGTFNKSTATRGVFNQSIALEDAFNQERSGHNSFNKATSGKSAFNQGNAGQSGAFAFNKVPAGQGTFALNQESTGQDAFNLGNTGQSTTNQGPKAFASIPNQGPKAFVNTSNQNTSQNASSVFAQQKRGGGRGGSNIRGRGGARGAANTTIPTTQKRGGTTTSPVTVPAPAKATTAKRGGKAAPIPPWSHRKPKNDSPTTPKESNKMTAPKEGGKITAADRAQRFGSTEKSLIYDRFKEDRVRERQQAIENGLIPDPNNPTRLEDAIDFRGTCLAKCPEFEMLEREIQNGLDSLETDGHGNLDPGKAVKAYRRSAAGIDQPLPTDVRTPEALVHTLDYLINDVLSQQALDRCHAFVRDRTRSIRQDFTLQNIRDITAVQVHERIARFHILCLHEMCEYDESKFSKQQETEQLRKVLVSLMEFYDDLREEGIETENEAEFRAYNIVSLIRDQDIARQTMTLPMHLFRHPLITRALEFRALSQRSNEIMETSSRRNKPENIEASQNFYSQFFKLIADPGTSFLMACMLECHFADVRKGALKAMNVSYMIKVGGVQAEDVRQVLAYDNLKQLLEEAHLYGIQIDNSLGEPTLCFGQKHYITKAHFFIEPLSNAAQKKSMLLVEPKKAGRPFRDIVNGVNSNVVPLPNQNVFARQPNPIKSADGSNKQNTAKAPPTFNLKLTELTGEDEAAAIKKKQEDEKQLEVARSKAAAAAALAARERKKMEELEERKRLEAERKEAEAKRIESERRLLEQKIREEEELIRRQEREREEEMTRQEILRRQEREKQIADMHKNVVKSQLQNRWFDELLAKAIRQQTKAAVQKAIRSQKLIKKITTPWIAKARSSISKRNAKAMERKRRWYFNMFFITKNPYMSCAGTIYTAKPSHSTPEGIRERVYQSIQAEKIALENVQPVNEAAVWKAEEFPLCIYPRIRDKMMDLKQSRNDGTRPSWQLIINVPDSDLDSSVWYKRKFGLDEVGLRKDGLYLAFNVLIRMITPQHDVSCDLAEEAGAVIFSLPESKAEKNQAEFAAYWEENRQRLEQLTESLKDYNPGMKAPFLFTYFPDSSSTESTLEKIPTLLGLDNNMFVSDYHILVMNPQTISERIIHEVNWLSNNTVINQE